MAHSTDLAGRHVLVTGAAAGIGAAIATAMAAAGADVLVTDIDEQGGAALAATIGARFHRLDVTDGTAISAVADGPGFDVLVNNAGQDQHSFFSASSPAEWDHLIAVNLLSVLRCTHAVLPGMHAARFGRIINIASEAARLGSKGGSVYAAAKGGVVSFTKSIARESARFGVTANVICPGPIRTPMLEAAIAKGGDRLLDAMTGATLIGRLGEPEEVAALALFLASDMAGYITGEVIGVSGGMGC